MTVKFVIVKSEVALNDAAMCRSNSECYGCVSNVFPNFNGSVLQSKPGSDVVILAKNGFCKCDETLNLLDEL